MSEAGTKSREELLLWMEVLEEYGRDWDETFEHSASYFTQEFWYLLVNCMINAWKAYKVAGYFFTNLGLETSSRISTATRAR